MHGARNVIEAEDKEGEGDRLSGVILDLETERARAWRDGCEASAGEVGFEFIESWTGEAVRGRRVREWGLGGRDYRRRGIGQGIEICKTGAIHAKIDLVLASAGNFPGNAHDALEKRVREGLDSEGVNDGEWFGRSDERGRMDLQGKNNLLEVVKNLGGVDGLDRGVRIEGVGDDDLQEEFVAGSVGKTGIVAILISRASGSGASFSPMEGDALNGSCAGDAIPV